MQLPCSAACMHYCRPVKHIKYNFTCSVSYRCPIHYPDTSSAAQALVCKLDMLPDSNTLVLAAAVLEYLTAQQPLPHDPLRFFPESRSLSRRKDVVTDGDPDWVNANVDVLRVAVEVRQGGVRTLRNVNELLAACEAAAWTGGLEGIVVIRSSVAGCLIDGQVRCPDHVPPFHHIIDRTQSVTRPRLVSGFLPCLYAPIRKQTIQIRTTPGPYLAIPIQ